MRRSDAEKWRNELYTQRHSIWTVARMLAQQQLEDAARQALEASSSGHVDASRIRVESRVKNNERFLEKLIRKTAELPTPGHPKTAGQCEQLVGDVIGLRAIGKSLRDVDLFVEALDRACAAGVFRRTKVKDYRISGDPGPKRSGYRAYHADLEVTVTIEGQPVTVGCELQVKTMLQVAWGELTHEDLYKPDAALRPTRFHQSVGKSMAELLNAVDELADQLALELSEQFAAPPQEPDADQREAKIIRVEPNYALGMVDGRRGLIPAVAIKELLDSEEYIDVDDHLQVGDRVRVRLTEDGGNLFLYPVDDSELRSSSTSA